MIYTDGTPTFAMTDERPLDPEEHAAKLVESHEFDLASEWEAEAMAAQWDDDPNPYHGDYSEC